MTNAGFKSSRSIFSTIMLWGSSEVELVSKLPMLTRPSAAVSVPEPEIMLIDLYAAVEVKSEDVVGTSMVLPSVSG